MKTPKMKFKNFLMAFSLAVVLLLLLVISGIFYLKTKGFIEQKMEFINGIKLSQISSDIVASFDDAYNMLESLRNNERLLRYVHGLESEPGNSVSKYYLSVQLKRLLFNAKKDNGFIQTIIVQTDRTEYSSDDSYMYTGELPTGTMLQKNMGDRISLVSAGDAYTFFSLNRDELTVPGLRGVLDQLNRRMFFAGSLTDQQGDAYGIVFMLLNPDYFTQKIPYSNDIAIVDRDGDFVYNGHELAADEAENLLRKANADGRSSYSQSMPGNKRIWVKDIAFNNFKLIVVEHLDIGRKQLRLITTLTAGVFIGCALLSYIFSRAVTGQVLRPLHRLVRQMENYGLFGDRLAVIRGKAGKTRRMTLRDRFFVYFLMTLLLPLLIYVVVFYFQSIRIVGSEMRAAYAVVFNQTAHRIELFLNQKLTALATLSYDALTRDYVLNQQAHTNEELHQLMRDSEYLGLYNDTVSIYDTRNKQLFSNRNKKSTGLDETLYTQMLSSGQYLLYHLDTNKTGPSTIQLGIPIYNFGYAFGNQEKIGYMILEMDSKELSGLYDDFKDDQIEAFLLDDSNVILSHPDSTLIGATSAAYNNRSDEERFIFASRMASLPWYFISRFDYTAVKKQTLDLIYDDIYILLIIFLLAFVFSYLMSHYLVKPLQKLSFLFVEEHLADLHRPEHAPAYGIDEVEQLNRTFNRMLERIESLVEESLIASGKRIRLEYEKRETQIIALQAQINPHFLYNTLENLVYLVESGEKDNAVDMIQSLSRLFRYSISQGQAVVSIEEEIMYAQAYTRIMTNRYKEDMRCVWTIEEEAFAYMVIKLILQPVIENAIQHGVRKKKDVVTIRIECIVLADVIQFLVRDDGPGVSPSQLADLNRQLAGNTLTKGGMFNVNTRIKLHFGNDYGLHMDSVVNEGTTVTITLPQKKRL
ncbi:cache domain-containing sensor histidine kinase [Paenibacillus koleovorans]|uniref:cache domain-containing sensor histidine kinase n=1 Tax=Paenibacillus koleovorans TaxID=121608 RepID=UPI000FD701A1|nr:histidine kinase [Paenibacillus koleovorans]